MRLMILGAGAVVSEYYAPALRMLGWQQDALVVDASADALTSFRNRWPRVRTAQMDVRETSRVDCTSFAKSR
jgi:hypothetical protein